MSEQGNSGQETGRERRRHPRFVRANYGRIRKVGRAWRRPRGIDSKQRVGLNYAGAKPEIGYRSMKKTRGLHPSGLAEERVSRPEELKAVAARRGTVFAARIAGGVGKRKAAEIRKAAGELGIKVLN
ncbi:MAG: 50S ribosomal protein L32e [Candidatus Micrarchaeota archaeon]|nr:50S ribosomal protein L32e [Candidatus Micrarchaeota archaeon]